MKAAQTRQLDLVATDLAMPVMDGRELTRRLQEDQGYMRLPVIIVSASASAVGVEGRAFPGADAFLTKPIDAEELLLEIAELLELEWVYGDPEDDSAEYVAELTVPGRPV